MKLVQHSAVTLTFEEFRDEGNLVVRLDGGRVISEVLGLGNLDSRELRKRARVFNAIADALDNTEHPCTRNVVED